MFISLMKRIYITEKTHRALKALASLKGLTLTDMSEAIIIKYINKKKKEVK
jgi:hypothetical protein